MERGLIHIYTGDGKGKTTAAAGLCVRARSRGLRVLFAQFMKKASGGESDLLRELSVDVKIFEGVASPLFTPGIDRSDIRNETRKALNFLASALKDYDLVVLDEFNCLIDEGYVTPEECIEFLKKKPEALELVLTGRHAHESLLEYADQVTEMKDVKHPYRKGERARAGIEY